MLMPKKLKHRKQPRGKMRGMSQLGNSISFGQYALKSLGRSWITARQLEAARRALTRYIARGGKVWIRIFPHKPVTKSGAETKLGGGKGSLDHFVATVKPGRIIFEMDGVSHTIAQEALRLASNKLPVKTCFIDNNKQ